MNVGEIHKIDGRLVLPVMLLSACMLAGCRPAASLPSGSQAQAPAAPPAPEGADWDYALTPKATVDADFEANKVAEAAPPSAAADDASAAEPLADGAPAGGDQVVEAAQPEDVRQVAAQEGQGKAGGGNLPHPFPQRVAIPEFSRVIVLPGSIGNNAGTITGLSTTTNITVGMLVTGPNIPANTIVTSIASATSVTISNPVTPAVSAQPITFTGIVTWLNTQPLTKQDLKGKFVLLDFWTYCCINCIHILPELKILERQFPNNLVVIGVHSAKFETEKRTDNIREAILRYEIEHPVINDADHALWDAYGINSWPSIALIDPEGNLVGKNSGEFKAAGVAAVLTRIMPYYRENNLLDEKPLQFALETLKEQPTPLRYPGKILADEKGNRLFISDSNHNRIVITTLDGQWIENIGSGEIGVGDGDFQTVTFNHPQGCALAGEVLYVADTESHTLRKVDLKAKTVTTIAGTGEQASNPFPGWDGQPVARPRRWVGPPRTTALNSPWALWVHKTDLFIAMAGSHQIWKMPLDESEIGPYAGNAREDIVDGTLLPKSPFLGGGASVFAQPSGLTADGTWLYVADSEGSSIRRVPLKQGTLEVGTVVGSALLPNGTRLFAFGDRDGPKAEAKLQHALEVVYLDNKIYVADTYNHKIKVVAKNGDTKTLAGTGKPGSGDSPAEFHEPAGLAHAKGKLYVADTNNHLIRTIDLATGKVATLAIAGLEPAAKPAVAGAGQ